MLTPIELDNILVAMADETRRRIMARLSEGEARVTEVAAPFAISLNSVSKHIRILERAALIKRRCVGRDHFLSLNPQPMQDATEWMRSRQALWSGSLAKLAAALDEQDACDQSTPYSRPALTRPLPIASIGEPSHD